MIDDQSEPGSWRDALQWRQALEEALQRGPAVESSKSVQVGGDHYTSKAIQPWDAMEAWMPDFQFIGFLRGNAIKYLARAGTKGSALEDYKKAQHYLDKLIEVMEGNGDD